METNSYVQCAATVLATIRVVRIEIQPQQKK